jgi:octaprenyl-diphosphate synthase
MDAPMNAQPLMQQLVERLQAEPTANGVAHLQALVAEEMQQVNQRIFSLAQSHVDLIPRVSEHLIRSGGKRLRPMLTLAAAKLCGYQGEEHLKLASAVEFLHTATLLHDDVVDGSEHRRGKPTANHAFGNKVSVLVGDFLLGQAFRLMVDTGEIEALKILSDAAAVIAEGEVWQLASENHLALERAQYEQVITAKTACLFAAACEVGAVIAGADAAHRKALATFGLPSRLSMMHWITPPMPAPWARTPAMTSAKVRSPCR